MLLEMTAEAVGVGDVAVAHDVAWGFDIVGQLLVTLHRGRVDIQDLNPTVFFG